MGEANGEPPNVAPEEHSKESDKAERPVNSKDSSLTTEAAGVGAVVALAGETTTSLNATAMLRLISDQSG